MKARARDAYHVRRNFEGDPLSIIILLHDTSTPAERVELIIRGINEGVSESERNLSPWYPGTKEILEKQLRVHQHTRENDKKW